jgi:hypothetical protein
MMARQPFGLVSGAVENSKIHSRASSGDAMRIDCQKLARPFNQLFACVHFCQRDRPEIFPVLLKIGIA